LESPTQTVTDAATQSYGGRICGKAHRGGSVPSVKAYVGPLPEGARGVEFVTDIPPLTGTAPHLALWRKGSHGVENASDDLVCIPVSVTKNTQTT
jgi:hypothetical protein